MSAKGSSGGPNRASTHPLDMPSTPAPQKRGTEANISPSASGGSPSTPITTAQMKLRSSTLLQTVRSVEQRAITHSKHIHAKKGALQAIVRLPSDGWKCLETGIRLLDLPTWFDNQVNRHIFPSVAR